jgi:hypothetical protein
MDGPLERSSVDRRTLGGMCTGLLAYVSYYSLVGWSPLVTAGVRVLDWAGLVEP